MVLFPGFVLLKKKKKFQVISVKAPMVRLKRPGSCTLCCTRVTLHGVLSKALSSSPVVPAPFFVKAILQCSGNVTCLPAQGWARDSFSEHHLNEGNVPLFHRLQSQPMPLGALRCVPTACLLLASFLRLQHRLTLCLPTLPLLWLNVYKENQLSFPPSFS